METISVIVMVLSAFATGYFCAEYKQIKKEINEKGNSNEGQK